MDDYTAPEFGRSALITIDTQRCTLDGEAFEVPGTSEVVPRIAALTKAFREAGRPVIHVIRLYKPDGSNAERCRRQRLVSGAELALVGSSGRMPVDEILPSPLVSLDDFRLLGGEVIRIATSEWVIYKPRWGAFYKTQLESFLLELDVSTIVLTGCNYPNCPRTTLYEASERDFRLVAIVDGISKLTEKGSAELEAVGVSLYDAKSCISEIRRTGPNCSQQRSGSTVTE